MQTVVVLLLLIVGITAHSSFSGLIINGKARGDCVRPKFNPHLNWPVHIHTFYPDGINSNNYSCGFLPEAGREAPATCDVEAGSTIAAAWSNPWEADIYPIMIEEHRGPIWIYLARHDHGNGGIPSGNKWFKIAQFAFTGKYTKSDNWEKVDWACPYTLWKNTGTISMPGYPNCQYGSQSFTIPADLAPGDYLLRAEIATLQNTGMGTGYAQLYVHCAQIRITGGGNADPPNKVSLPGAYRADHPGLNYVVWRDYANPYQFPGPDVYVAQPPAPPTPIPPPNTPVPVPEPTPTPAAPFPAASSYLQSGYLLSQGSSLVDPLGNYALMMQSDGNLVLYDTSKNAIWATGTSDGLDNDPFTYALSVQNDGNIVVYKTRPELKGVWNSGTNGKGVAPYFFVLQSDRNMVLFDKANKVIWHSRTGVELGNLQAFNNATGSHQFDNATIESGAVNPFEIVGSSEMLTANLMFAVLIAVLSIAL